MRRFLLAVFCTLAVAPTPGLAQDIPSVKADISRVLAEMENNLIVRDAISMNGKDWSAKAESAKARSDDLNRRFTELNAYCRGTFETPEYERRIAHCDSVGAQLETLKAQLNLELGALAEQGRTLQKRNEDQAKSYQALEATLGASLPKLISLCAGAAPSDRGACRMPTAPGPRTAPMVAEWNTTLTNLFTP